MGGGRRKVKAIIGTIRSCFSAAMNQQLLMEETCDSESVLNSAGASSSSISSYVAGRFNELDDLFIADDAVSTTSSTNSVEDLNKLEECYKLLGEPIPHNYIIYLQKTSDEELGLPPKPDIVDGVAEMVELHDFDLDFDEDRNPREVDHSLFWLSFLPG